MMMRYKRLQTCFVFMAVGPAVSLLVDVRFFCIHCLPCECVYGAFFKTNVVSTCVYNPNILFKFNVFSLTISPPVLWSCNFTSAVYLRCKYRKGKRSVGGTGDVPRFVIIWEMYRVLSWSGRCTEICHYLGDVPRFVIIWEMYRELSWSGRCTESCHYLGDVPRVVMIWEMYRELS